MKLYTTPTCGPCQMVKKVIENDGLDVEIVDDPGKFPEEVRSVPVLDTGSGVFMEGAPAILHYFKEVHNA